MILLSSDVLSSALDENILLLRNLSLSVTRKQSVIELYDDICVALSYFHCVMIDYTYSSVVSTRGCREFS